MSGSLLRKSNGQFAPADREHLRVEPAEPTPPNTRKTTPRNSGPPASFDKSFEIAFSNRTADVHNEPREALIRDCATVYRAAILLNTILGLLYDLLWTAKWLVFLYFVGNVFVQGTLYNLASIFLHCTIGKGQNFSSRVTTAIYPTDMAETSPNLQVTVRESGRIGAEILFDQHFPLSINNVVVHLVILAVLILDLFIVRRLQRLLAKIARLARDASPDRTLERTYGQLPVPM
jgi:hypothetical protein